MHVRLKKLIFFIINDRLARLTTIITEKEMMRSREYFIFRISLQEDGNWKDVLHIVRYYLILTFCDINYLSFL